MSQFSFWPKASALSGISLPAVLQQPHFGKQ